jgi:hypothetical protein
MFVLEIVELTNVLVLLLHRRNLPFHFSKGHEPEAIDFVLAALHAHIGVLQWAE